MAWFGSPESTAWWRAHGTRADSVELKAVLDGTPEALAESLTGRRDPTWSERSAYLLDTPDLDLLRGGVEVRLRCRARRRVDLAVSAHRGGPEAAGPAPPGARVELDLVPGGMWCDVEVRREVDPDAAAAVIAGRAPAAALLSAPQRAWAARAGSAGLDVELAGRLRVHGPLVVRRVKVGAARGLRRADLEHLRFPSGRELLELSTHCAPADAGPTTAAFERLLEERALRVVPCYPTRAVVWCAESGGSPPRGGGTSRR